jgi:hypothetical protein
MDDAIWEATRWLRYDPIGRIAFALLLGVAVWLYARFFLTDRKETK